MGITTPDVKQEVQAEQLGADMPAVGIRLHRREAEGSWSAHCLRKLLQMLPAGAVGVSLALGCAPTIQASTEEGGTNAHQLSRGTIAERLSATRDAVSALSGDGASEMTTEERYAQLRCWTRDCSEGPHWGYWWRNGAHWHNWPGPQGRHSWANASQSHGSGPQDLLKIIVVAGAGIGVVALAVRHGARHHRPPPSVSVTLGVDRGCVRITRRARLRRTDIDPSAGGSIHGG